MKDFPKIVHSVQIKEPNMRSYACVMDDNTVQFTFIRKAKPDENLKELNALNAQMIDRHCTKRKQKFTYMPLRVTKGRLIDLFRLVVHMLLFNVYTKDDLHYLIEEIAQNDEEIREGLK